MTHRKYTTMTVDELKEQRDIISNLISEKENSTTRVYVGEMSAGLSNYLYNWWEVRMPVETLTHRGPRSTRIVCAEGLENLKRETKQLIDSLTELYTQMDKLREEVTA